MLADFLPDLRSRARAKATAPTRAARRASGRVGAGRPTAAEARRERVYKRALSLIAARCGEADLTVEDVAKAIPVPARTLQHNLAAHEQSFRELLGAVRIERAAELVLADPLGSGVAEKVGYGHENHLARAFERRLGISPSVLGKAVCARDRHEWTRAQPPPESDRSREALEVKMRKDAVLVGYVDRQLAAA